eukprot:gnl/Spiro4/477_TR263_c0_g1_i1.p1 gnl/Spiro4/477_TR263_c0_g1~~gnl/Spiro4/477_TR263_c0_g1_i1.p1  ORF type:complete len:561 (+),score=227.35 gnl/Spiro4/477_TR263_c0_g1_i1:64-1746(+)
MRLNKNRKGFNRETNEMRRLRLEKQMFRQQMARKQKEEIEVNEKKELLKAEMKSGRLNRRKINQNWRRLLQPNKLEQLKNEIEIHQKNYERVLDRRDTQIKILDRELQVAENKHLQAYNEYVKRADLLCGLQQTRRRALDNEFSMGLEAIRTEFETERVEIVTNHMRDKRFIGQLMWEMQVEWDEETQAQINDFNERRNQQDTAADDERNVLSVNLEGFISHLNEEQEKLRRRSQQDKLDLVERFEKIKTECNEDDDLIKANTKYNNRQKKALKDWKLKILHTTRECSERNNTLREEREAMSRHFHDLKSKMQRMRELEKTRLAALIHNSRKCLTKLQGNLNLGERIFRLVELNRKLESEREKLLPYYSSTVPAVQDDADADAQEHTAGQQQQPWQPHAMANANGPQSERERTDLLAQLLPDPQDDAKELMRLLQPSAVQVDGQPLRDTEYLDNFFKRFNKVKLDQIALEAEKARLQAENTKLRSTLKQYLDGISVNQDVLSTQNALFIANQATLFRPKRSPLEIQPTSQVEIVHKPIIEAAMVAQTAAHAARVASRVPV